MINKLLETIKYWKNQELEDEVLSKIDFSINCKEDFSASYFIERETYRRLFNANIEGVQILSASGYGLSLDKIKNLTDNLILSGNYNIIYPEIKSFSGDKKRVNCTPLSKNNPQYKYLKGYFEHTKALSAICKNATVKKSVLVIKPKNENLLEIFKKVSEALIQNKVEIDIISENLIEKISNSINKIYKEVVLFDNCAAKVLSKNTSICNLLEGDREEKINEIIEKYAFIKDSNKNIYAKELYIDKIRLIVAINNANTSQFLSLNGIGAGALAELNLEVLDYSKIAVDSEKLKLLPNETKVFVVDENVLESDEVSYLTLTGKDWEIEKSSSNVLVLDRCEAIIDGVSYPMAYVMGVRKIIEKIKPKKVVLKYEFTSEKELKNCFIGLETGDISRIEFNKKVITEKADKMAVSTINKYPIEVLRGVNNFAVYYTNNGKTDDICGIENAYIFGDFLLKVAGESRAKGCIKFNEVISLVPEKSSIKINSIASSGRHYFAGSITVKKVIKLTKVPSNCYLALKLQNCLAVVYINGKEACTYLFNGRKKYISTYLRDGENEVKIKIVVGLRNLFGPFHNKEGDLESFSKKDFLSDPLFVLDGDNDFTEQYYVKDFGISTDL